MEAGEGSLFTKMRRIEEWGKGVEKGGKRDFDYDKVFGGGVVERLWQ